MSCKDKSSNIDDVVSDICKDLKLDQINQAQTEELFSTNPELAEIIEQQALCDLPSDPVFTMSQLEELGCDVDLPQELPEIVDNIDLDTDSLDQDNGERCEAALEKANSILKEEQKEFSELRIILEKLIEYRDNYIVVLTYFKARASEMNRLLNKFQPILEEIRNLENKKTNLQNQSLSLYAAAIEANSNGDTAQYDILISRYTLVNTEISTVDEEIETQKTNLSNSTNSETILSNENIKNISKDYQSGYTVNAINLVSAVTYTLNSAGFSSIKNSIRGYSSALDISKNTPLGISGLINKSSIRFKLNFVGLNYIVSEEDIYNEKTGTRSSKQINFPIKNNTRLEKRNFFDGTASFDVTGIDSETNFTGVLYTQYYNKLNDPLTELFTLNEKGLTSQETLVDPNLKSTGLAKKREAAGEFFIQDFGKMERFYQNLETNIEGKKSKIREQRIKPSFQTISQSLTNLAKADVGLLLSIGGVNVDITNESQNLKSVIDSIEQSQLDIISKGNNLDGEIERIENRISEIKPTADRVKKLLVSIDSECFSEKSQPLSKAELESKVEKAKGNDPFGIKSLVKTDPTLPTILDFKYWLEFSKILNKVALLPFPKSPISLRYWPIGLFFPTPAGKLIKIPLPIIWIPLIVIPNPTGVIVIFLTINGSFISPVMFRLDSTGAKYHQLTIRGPGPRFGYSQNDLIKSIIQVPLNKLAFKDSIITSRQNGLDKLTKPEKEIYQIERQSLVEKLNRAKIDSTRYAKLKKKISDLDESISPKTQNQKLQEEIDKPESAVDAIETAKAAVKDRMNQLGEPEFANSLAIQQQIEANRESLKKRIDETYKSKLTPKEKRKALNGLRGQLSKENVSMSNKKMALKKDIMSFFDKIKLPTIQIPRDSTKLNPAPSSLEQLKSDSKQQVSNFKNDPTSKRNRNVKDSMKRELNSILDIVDVMDLPINSKGKISINGNEKKIKSKLKEITRSLTDKLEGKSTLDVESLQQENIDLENKIENETDTKKKRDLKKRLANNNSKLSNHNETEQLKLDNSMTPEKLKEVSENKFSFNPFKSLSELLPVEINFTPPNSSLEPIEKAKLELNTYIDSLSPAGIKELFGGQSEISPNTIKDLYFNIINERVSSNLNIPNKIEQKDILASFSGVLKSLSLPSKSFDLLKKFTLSKKITVDLNLLIGPLRNLILQDMDDLLLCLPVDLENNFSSLNSTDIKSELESKVLNKLDGLTGKLESFYSIINLTKSTKGISLTKQQLSSFIKPPFGPIDFANFSKEALLKLNSANSANLVTFDLASLENAKKSIEPIVAPIMDNPASYIIPVSAASVGLSDIQRKLHPILNADDLPPWERLSSRNFLFILFLDEFISSAADKVGFFRTFI
jgi:hypothetical protein